MIIFYVDVVEIFINFLLTLQVKPVMPSNQFNGTLRRNSLNPMDNSEVCWKALILILYSSPSSSFFKSYFSLSQRYFHPITTNQPIVGQGGPSNSPVELQVTNLDQNMEPNELRKCLLDAFSEYTKVSTISLFIHLFMSDCTELNMIFLPLGHKFISLFPVRW